jgi:hypothetical protein
VWAPRTAAPFMQNTGSYVLKVHGMTYKAGRRIRNEQLNFFFCYDGCASLAPRFNDKKYLIFVI